MATWQLLVSYLLLSSSFCFSAFSWWSVFCFWYQTGQASRGVNCSRESQRKRLEVAMEGSRPGQRTDDCLPEKYQEYSHNPVSFKSHPIQSRDPSSPCPKMSWPPLGYCLLKKLHVNYLVPSLLKHQNYFTHHRSVPNKLGELFFNKLIIPQKWD